MLSVPLQPEVAPLPASTPTNVFLDPTAFSPADFPTAVELLSVVKSVKAKAPQAVLDPPVVWFSNALSPTAELLAPVVFKLRALQPQAVLAFAVVLLSNAP